jgi:fluoroquinolone transport system permease protein
MGLFFMGAIVLLEKSQRVTSFFAVTPLNASEYVCSKVLSLGAIAVFVAALLAKAADLRSMFSVITGTLLSSILFTLFGVIIATKITSLNQFILATVPVEIVGFVPAILHLFGTTSSIGRIYPANACIDMIAGKGFSLSGFLITLVLIILLFRIARDCVEKMWQSQGGIKI